MNCSVKRNNFKTYDGVVLKCADPVFVRIKHCSYIDKATASEYNYYYGGRLAEDE